VQHSAENEKRLRLLLARVGDTLAEVEKSIAMSDRLERTGEVTESLAVMTAIATNLWLIFVSHLEAIDFAALWLPSVLGAFSLLRSNRRTAERIPMLSDFAQQLRLIKAQMITLSHWTTGEPSQQSTERETILRLLCKLVGQYCQRELQLAMSQQRAPELPV
jgi:hypothetical protein